jgi:hypothetical protein
MYDIHWDALSDEQVYSGEEYSAYLSSHGKTPGERA